MRAVAPDRNVMSTSPAVPAAPGHHHLAVSEVLLLLGTHGNRGLDEREAAARLGRFGPNSLPPIKGPGALARWSLS